MWFTSLYIAYTVVAHFMYVHYICTYVTFLAVTEENSTEKPSPPTNTSATDDDDDSNTVTVVVIVVPVATTISVIAVVVLVAVALYFLWNRKKNKSDSVNIHGMYMCSNYFHIWFYMHK